MIMSRLFFYLPVLFVMLGLPAETFANQKFGGVLLSPNGEARGVFTLTPTPGGLLVTANLKNMPEGQHAFHLHANPSCEDSFNAYEEHYATSIAVVNSDLKKYILLRQLLILHFS